jgi:hypothetical protein
MDGQKDLNLNCCCLAAGNQRVKRMWPAARLNCYKGKHGKAAISNEEAKVKQPNKKK